MVVPYERTADVLCMVRALKKMTKAGMPEKNLLREYLSQICFIQQSRYRLK